MPKAFLLSFFSLFIFLQTSDPLLGQNCWTGFVGNHTVQSSQWTVSQGRQHTPDETLMITGRVEDHGDGQQLRRYRIHIPDQDSAVLAFRHGNDGTFLLLLDSEHLSKPLNLAISRPGYLTAWIEDLQIEPGAWELDVSLKHRDRKGDRQRRDEKSAHPYGLTVFELPR